jgi:hypothetical protein
MRMTSHVHEEPSSFARLRNRLLEPILALPEWAFTAFLTLRIVNAFLMRAAEDPLCHHHAPNAMSTKKRFNFTADFGIDSNVQLALKPPTTSASLIRSVTHPFEFQKRCSRSLTHWR